MIDGPVFKKVSVFAAIGILAILSLLILWPLITAIITGLLLAFVFYPVYKRVVVKVIKEPNISALIIIVIFLFVIMIPLWFLFPILIRQIFDVYLSLQKINTLDLLTNIFPQLAQIEMTQELANSLNTFITGTAGKILSAASSIILNFPSLLLKAAVVLFVFFFGMKDAETLRKYVESLSPFSKTAEKDFSKKFQDITNSVIFGQIIVGIAQGIVTGIGLFVFGIPNALTLTLIATLVGILPIIGPWLVWIPVDVYLFVSGRTGAAIGLLVYGVIVITWIDALIRPYIVSRKTKISSAIILIGMIGGLIVFGILGLIIGPLILAYLLLILDAYRARKFPSLFIKEK